MQKLIENRKARAEYTILETYEAGLMLSGGEVKMLRSKRGSLSGAHIRIIGDSARLLNAQIPPYPYSRDEEYDPARTRKLLLHKKEIVKLGEMQKTKGLALIPLEIYAGKRFLKLRFGVGKGKKQYERREELKKRDLAREVERITKQRMR